MSLQRMGFYRYATAYKKDKKKYYDGAAYWEDALYIYEHYFKYIKGEEAELDELIWNFSDVRREVDIYLYVMGFIKGIYKMPSLPFVDDLKDRWYEDREQGAAYETRTAGRIVIYTENSYTHWRNLYFCPKNSAYYGGESIRISMCR